MRNFPTMLDDFIATHLRSQVHRLQGVLEHLENEKPDGGYMVSSLKDIEASLRQIRKVCETN
jgi:hypothetical protein